MIKLRAIADCTIQLEKARLDGSSEILFGILAHLIVERGKPVPKSRLVDAFWWNADDAEGRHCLRQTVYKLRQLGVPIESTAEAFTLGERAALADFDCADERTLALSPLPPEEAVAIFPGYAPRASAPFLTWLERTREKAGRSIRGVLVRALGEARRRNGWDEAAKLARQCLVLDPLNEEATLTLAEYTALQGDKREALRLIDSYMEEIGGTYGDLRIPASLLRNRISERVAYPPASAAGKIPIVGRDDSLRLLAGVSAEVSGGAGHTCVVHGPPGIGKTRLLTEFANISAMKGARIVRVDCHADAAERALSVFMELAPQLLRMPGALGCSPEALRLVRRLGRHDPNERLDPDEYGGAAFLHAAVRASLRDLIDAIAAERPLYLLIEDVHWIDPVSLEVLKEIIGSNRGRQLLVLMTTRTLGDGTLLEGVDRRQLIVHELSPLPDVAARRLAETLCGALAIEANASLVDWCMQRGAGNPLFMTELLAHWRETKDTERVPASLEALIDERVGALSEAGLRTLQAIALLEGEATYEMLEAVLGMQRWQVMGCVEELDKGGLVVGASARVIARHQLMAASARGRLTRAARQYLHAQIAQLFEKSFDDTRDPRTIFSAAEHYYHAGDTRRAVALSSAAAEQLAAVGAHSQAADMLERLLGLVHSAEDRLTLYETRRRMLLDAMRFSDIASNSQAAIALELDIHGGTHVHNVHELSLYMVMHHPEAAPGDRERAVAQMLSCAKAKDADDEHRLEASLWGAAVASADGFPDVGRQFFEATQLIQPTSPDSEYVRLKCELVFHTNFGSLESAVSIGETMIALASRLEPSVGASALRISSYPHRLLGNFDIAHDRYHQAIELGTRLAIPMQAAMAAADRAAMASEQGDYESAWVYYQKACDLSSMQAGRTPRAMAILGAEFSYMRGKLDLGDQFVASLPEIGPRRDRLCALCLRIFGLQARGRRVPREWLEAALVLHRSIAPYGWQDFPAAVLATTIAQRDGSLARTFVLEYCSLRRERWESRNPLLARIAANHNA